jgi:hypothetical protein
MGTNRNYTDQSGVIRQNSTTTAGSTDSPIAMSTRGRESLVEGESHDSSQRPSRWGLPVLGKGSRINRKWTTLTNSESDPARFLRITQRTSFIFFAAEWMKEDTPVVFTSLRGKVVDLFHLTQFSKSVRPFPSHDYAAPVAWLARPLPLELRANASGIGHHEVPRDWHTGEEFGRHLPLRLFRLAPRGHPNRMVTGQK